MYYAIAFDSQSGFFPVNTFLTPTDKIFESLNSFNLNLNWFKRKQMNRIKDLIMKD